MPELFVDGGWAGVQGARRDAVIPFDASVIHQADDADATGAGLPVRAPAAQPLGTEGQGR